MSNDPPIEPGRDDGPAAPGSDEEHDSYTSHNAGSLGPDPLMRAADPAYPLPDVPMARPVAIENLPPGLTGQDITSSVVLLSPWTAFLQILALLIIGLLSVVLAGWSTAMLSLPDPRWKQTVITAFAGLVTLLAAFGLTRLAGQRVSAIGWRVDSVASDVALGVGTVIGTYSTMIMAAVVVTLIRPDLLETSTQAQRAIQETIPPSSVPALIAMMAFVSLWEEVVFRGFLLTRLYAMFRRWWMAVIVGSLLFAAGHIYQGVMATVVIGFIGVVLGALFVWRRSLLAPFVFHLIFNVAALLVLRSQSENWQ